MDFENPLPVLELDTDFIEIETKDIFTGRFKIKNTGGGVLKGRALSRLLGLNFEPEEWEGNNQTITYTWNPSRAGAQIGETIQAICFITSNGGEVELPVQAKLTKMSIITSEGKNISNIFDFYEYSQTHPTQARRMFTDSEFYMLLLATGYTYIEVYESLHKDANRERAMDNFFILSGLKGRTKTEIKARNLEFSQKPGDKEKLYGNFLVKKSDHGYVDAPLTLKNNAPWLTLSTGKLSATDFNDDFIAVVNFSIDSAKISKAYARELVVVGADDSFSNTVEIIYRRRPGLTARLNKNTYRYSDKGTIEIINNTGELIKVTPFCKENYIRFSAKSFAVEAVAEIPFEVKLGAFMSAQMFFRKLPYMKTIIEVEFSSPGKTYKKNLPITVGEW